MNFFKKFSNKKTNKIFNYSIKSNGEILEYSYAFVVKKNTSKEDLIKICYQEFVNRHSIDMIDNIIEVSLK